MPRGNFLSTNQKHYQDLGSARHRYGISTLVSQTSFCEGSSGDLARRGLFSQATENSLILRPCCFKYILCWLFVSAFLSFSFFQEILDGRVFLSLTLFFRLCIQEHKVLYMTFTHSLVHVVLGTELLQRPYFRGGQFSLVEQFLYLDTREKFISLLC